MKKISLALTGLTLTLPSFAHAAWWDLSGNALPCANNSCAGGKDAGALLLQQVINFVLGFAALVAVLFLIFGGVLYIVSAGNETRAKQAKQTILYAVIGLVVVVLSFFIVQLVMGFVKPLGK
jgi:hypothetical protein